MTETLTLIQLVNENLRFLNKTLLGETATAPDDQFGKVGEAVAANCARASEMIEQLRVTINDGDEHPDA